MWFIKHFNLIKCKTNIFYTPRINNIETGLTPVTLNRNIKKHHSKLMVNQYTPLKDNSGWPKIWLKGEQVRLQCLYILCYCWQVNKLIIYIRIKCVYSRHAVFFQQKHSSITLLSSNHSQKNKKLKCIVE